MAPFDFLTQKPAAGKRAFLAHSADEATPTGIALYSRFALAGALGCAITHGALTPVDVVKTRIQLEPEVYNKGMVDGFKKVISKEGAGALLTGLGPTVGGYFLQGAFKFGGYEFFKKNIVNALGGPEEAIPYRTSIYLVSAGIAEFFADVALCPLEATRIRLVSQPTFATGLVSGFTRILREEGVLAGFYSGFGPILFKQVPYTMAKFVVFERLSESIYDQISTPKDQMSGAQQTGINLLSGVGAGAVAAVISQPADTLLSKVNKEKGEGPIMKRLVDIAKRLGPQGLFLGLGARVVMIGTLTAGQFAIYGDIKKAVGAAKGSTEIPKAPKA